MSFISGSRENSVNFENFRHQDLHQACVILTPRRVPVNSCGEDSEFNAERIVLVSFVIFQTAEPVAAVEFLQCLDVLIAQLEVKHVEVGFNSCRSDRLWNDDDTAIDLETKENGCGSLAVFGTHFLDLRVLQKRGLVGSGPVIGKIEIVAHRFRSRLTQEVVCT